MPVSGLVVTFAEEIGVRENAINAIGKEPRIEMGVTQSRRMAIVVDTASDQEDKELWNWLNRLPGVVFVDVVMVGFEEQAQEAGTR